MEAIWHTTATQAPNGAIGRMTNDDLADQISYSGNADHLVAAIVEATFFDEHNLHRLIVHDWHIHSDNTIDAQLYRRGVRYANGTIPRGSKLGEKERDRLADQFFPKPAESLFDQQQDLSVDRVGHSPDPAADNVVSIAAAAAEPTAPLGAVRSLPVPVPGPVPDPAPVPEPATTPTPPPLRRGARRELEQRITAAKETSPGKALDEAAQYVLTNCSITGLKAVSLHVSLWVAIDAECQRVKKPPEEEAMNVAETMVANYAQYVQDGDLLEYRWSIQRFFEEGHWRNWRGWPINRKALEERQRTGTYIH